MVDLRKKVFRKISAKEVPFNYQFGGLLGYSLEAGSDLISAIHPEVSMNEDTRLVALQSESELQEEVDGVTYEIDIAFRDSETLLGIESKRLDSLSKGQLEGELRVLEKNSDGREVVLLAISEDTNEPGVVGEAAKSTDHTVLWTSWHRIADDIERREFETKYEPNQKNHSTYARRHRLRDTVRRISRA